MRRVRKMSSMRGLRRGAVDRSRMGLEGGEGVHANGTAAEVAGGVVHHGPHVLTEGGAEEHQEAVGRLAEDRAARARDGAGAPSVHGRYLRPEVDRREAREHLARLWAENRHRSLRGRDIDYAGETVGLRG